jgi:GR25 family glycosyltransferase involved in LPS biosynthesis
MKISFIVLFLLCFASSNPCSALNIKKHLKTITDKTEQQIRNIDFIYLINLDQRPERLERCRQQLMPYGIHPFRFSAVYGWTLSVDTLNDIGVKFLPGMERGHWASHFPFDGDGNPEDDFLREACYGKTYFSRWMTRGAIGCALSHLSVLQDAYDSGYQTIWVMEDDIDIKDNPHKLADLIDSLDALVGSEGWDVLYTDMVESEHCLDPKLSYWWMWRPDLPSMDNTALAKLTILNEDFAQIGSRAFVHSMIIRRSGMKKILDFIKNKGIYIPYDHELSLAPGIQLYCLRKNLVTFKKTSSDTENKNF